MDPDTANTFRREFRVSSQAPMRGSDRKKLRRELASVFPRLNLRRDGGEAGDDTEPSVLDELLPPKEEVIAHKVSNRSTFYSLKDGPALFVDIDSRRHLIPTLRVLWQVPDLLPSLFIHPPVSSYLIGTRGADLMLPGVVVPAEGFGDLQLSAVRAVSVIGNPLPIGVGLLTMNNEFHAVSGGRGKILRIVHIFRDALWEFGHMGVPNPGFAYKDSVRALEEAEEKEKEDEGEGEGAETVAAAVEELAIDEEGEGSAAVEEPSGSGSGVDLRDVVADTTDMDARLETALLVALKTRVADSDLPMSQGSLWDRVLSCSTVPLDVKQSSYKTVSRFLSTMSKRRVIRAKEDKKRGEMRVTAVSRGHPLMTGAAGEEVVVDDGDKKGSESEGVPTQLQLIEMYRPSSVLKPLFEAVEADTSQYFTLANARAVLKAYIDAHGLVVRGDPRHIVVDALLGAALFKKKRDGDPPPTVARDDAFDRLIGNLKAFHAAVPAGTPMDCVELKKGCLQPIRVVSEVRQGRKHTTHVLGLELFGIDPDALAKEAQKRFACSCAASFVPGRTDVRVRVWDRCVPDAGQEVVIQGNVARETAEMLEKTHGIPRRLIEVEEKAKKKKK